MKVLCVIPARYASTRLPGKPLALIAGKPMIQHTYMRACEAEEPDDVIVATDNEKVYDTVTGFGGKAVMTSPDHPSGTDRLAEVAMQYPDVDVIINVQGDEPMIDPDIIDRLAKAFEGNDDLKMATMKVPMNMRVYKHVGVYAYRRDFLLQYAALEPTMLEKVEGLEQLRALENGYKIKVLESDFQGIGIDTPEDLEAINKLFAAKNNK